MELRACYNTGALVRGHAAACAWRTATVDSSILPSWIRLCHRSQVSPFVCELRSREGVKAVIDSKSNMCTDVERRWIIMLAILFIFSEFGKFSISCNFFSILAAPHRLFLQFFLPRFFDCFFDSSFLDFLILFPKFFLIWIRSAPSILPPQISSTLRGNRTSSPTMVVAASLITLSRRTSVCSIYRSNRSVNWAHHQFINFDSPHRQIQIL